MSELHGILFNAQILYSVFLGIWAAVQAGRGESVSGNFWGAILTYALLVGVTLVIGIILALQGMEPRDGRLWLYFLYMAFLMVIMPGLFTLLHGRDDRRAGLAFALLAFFNASVAISMVTREIVGPWIESA